MPVKAGEEEVDDVQQPLEDLDSFLSHRWHTETNKMVELEANTFSSGGLSVFTYVTRRGAPAAFKSCLVWCFSQQKPGPSSEMLESVEYNQKKKLTTSYPELSKVGSNAPSISFLEIICDAEYSACSKEPIKGAKKMSTEFIKKLRLMISLFEHLGSSSSASIILDSRVFH